jgi:hypothetical protein
VPVPAGMTLEQGMKLLTPEQTSAMVRTASFTTPH